MPQIWREWLRKLLAHRTARKLNIQRWHRPALEILEDRTLPSVSILSINRTTPPAALTGDTSVVFTATFSATATGVDPTDFTVVTGGTVGTVLTQVTPVSGAVYSVAVTGITGNGSLGLNLINNGTIHDSGGGSLNTTNFTGSSYVGQVYTIDHTFPFVVSINRANPVGAITRASAVSFLVTFSEPVTGVVAADFHLAQNGTAGATLTQLTASNNTVYTITVSRITGAGTLGLNLVDNSTIHDMAGNPLTMPNVSAPFSSQQTFKAGNGPHSAVIGDVNGDGKPDLVVANYRSNTASVLLGNGNGTFQAQQTYKVGGYPRSVALADVNGDGILDMVVANQNSNNVSVLLGNGNGTFQTQQTFATGKYPNVAIADVDGDGISDIVVSNRDSNTVSVLLGNGNGTFQAQQTFAVGAQPRFLALGDVNGDGKPDIAVANFKDNTVGVLLGNGNGTFQAQQTYAAGDLPSGVAIGDVNGDGKPDLAVANQNSYSVSVLLGNGNGSFQQQQTYSTTYKPRSVVIVDLNGDGMPDLALADRASYSVGVLLGNGNGTFQAQQTFPTANYPISVAVGDLNGDGRPDLVLPNKLSASVSVLLNTSNGGFTGQAYTIVAGVNHFAISGTPANSAAGNFFTFTVTVQDQSNNTVTSYTGTVHFSMSDTGVGSNVPVDYTFVTSDNGQHVFTSGTAFVTAGNQTFTATDTSSTFITGSAAVTVVAGVAKTLTLTAPVTATAGIAFSVNITAKDLFGNFATSYAGTVRFTTTDPQATPPTNLTLSAGTGSVSAILKTAGTWNLTAIDTATSSIVGTSNAITVTAAAASKFVVSGAPPTSTAGIGFPFTLTAEDQFNNPATAYLGTVHFTKSDAGAGSAVPKDYPFVTADNGQHVFTSGATFVTAGSQTFTATDTGSSGISASATVSVSAALAKSFAVAAPAAATAGAAFALTVMARDNFGNLVTGYAGTVHFTTSDPKATPPANATLTAGMGSFNAILETAGSQMLTAVDSVTTAVSGTSNAITVSAATAAKFVVSGAPPTSTAGSSFTFTVTAQDQFNNTATGYLGTIHFAKSDARVGSGVPGDYTFVASDNGQHLFTPGATLVTAGSQIITATDTASSNITGSAGVIVSAATATALTVTAPASAAAGVPFALSVAAKDNFGNLATNYAGTVHFSTTDGQATLPADSTLTSGTGTFSVTLKTAGVQGLMATDTATTSITGSAAVGVTAASANKLIVSAPSTAIAGHPFVFQVIPVDAFGNTATAYTGMVHFSGSDSHAILQTNQVLAGGIGFFAANLVSAGGQTITATDITSGQPSSGITGTSGTIAVSTTSVTHFSVAVPSSTAANNPIIAVVTALDSFGNVVSGYTGSIHLTSTDGQALLAANSTLSSGIGYLGVVFRTAGNETITATDTATASLFGTSTPIAVAGLAATHFVVTSSLPNGTTGTPIAFTVSAVDAFGNGSAAYAGTVHFTSSDTAISSGNGLPVNATLTAGQGVFNATFRTPGSQTVTATDTASASLTGTSNSIAAAGLNVTNLTPTPTGFVAVFNKPLDLTQINLYDQSGIDGSDDVTLTGPGSTQTSYHGSLIVDPTNTTITFVKTSDFNGINFNPATGTLAPGTYTATLRSAANGFTDLLGNLLDGGSNYTTTFDVTAAPVVVGIPAFARGPDSNDAINLPNNVANSGIPINLSSGAGVTSGQFTLQYNPAFLSITGATVNSTLAGATLSLDSTSTSGNAVIDFTTTGTLSTGMVHLGSLVAIVPNSAAPFYTQKALLHFRSEHLNGGTIAATGDDAVQVVAYLGDVNGDGQLSGGDAASISRVSAGFDTNPATGTIGGFSAYRLADPVIVGDLNSSGSVDAPDVTLINSFLSGTSRPQLATADPDNLTIPTNGPDPTLSVPSFLQATPGSTVVVPVNIDTARPAGSTGMTEAILAVKYDPRVFTVSAADVSLGSLPESAGGWQLSTVVNAQTGEIAIDLYGGSAIQTVAGGSLANIELHVRATGPAGGSGLTLVNQVNPTGQRVYKTTVDDGQGAFVLHLAGQDAVTPNLINVDLSPDKETGGFSQARFLAADPLAISAGAGTHGVQGDSGMIASGLPTDLVEQVFGINGEMLVLESAFVQPGGILTPELNQAGTSTTEQALIQQMGPEQQDWVPTDMLAYLGQTGKAGHRSAIEEALSESPSPICPVR